MTVTQLVTAAFNIATTRDPKLHQTWINISHRVGSLLPDSLLVCSVQQMGHLDMMLRCMEEDFTPSGNGIGEAAILAGHLLQGMLSELWVGAAYEVFRLMGEERKLAPDSTEFRALAHDLRLLRVPLEKHQIALDSKLTEPLMLLRNPSMNQSSDEYRYSRNDAHRAHIMPSGFSRRGSQVWQVIDLAAKESKWLERRALAERIVAFWDSSSEEAENR